MSPSMTSTFQNLRRNSLWSIPTRTQSRSSSESSSSSTTSSLSEKYGDALEVLGEGATGRVFLLQDTRKRLYAVKKLRRRRLNESRVEYACAVGMELRLGPSLQHQNVIQTVENLNDGGIWYKIMEHVPQDLFTIAMETRMEPKVVNCFFVQILQAITYLHAKGFAHRDLKLENVVVTDEGIAKLIDFGSAWEIGGNDGKRPRMALGNVGSTPYVAPEVLRRPYDPRAADIWSLAIIYCCMSIKAFPWNSATLEDNMFRKFIAPEEQDADLLDGTGLQNRHPKSGPQHLLSFLPADARPIIRKMLNVEPNSRASLLGIWQDKWVRSIEPCRIDDEGTFIGAPDHSHQRLGPPERGILDA